MSYHPHIVKNKFVLNECLGNTSTEIISTALFIIFGYLRFDARCTTYLFSFIEKYL